MQNDTIVGRCNREFDFHTYDLVNVKDVYIECEDDSLQRLRLQDIVMPEKFEMLRDAKNHEYNFDSRGECQMPQNKIQTTFAHLKSKKKNKTEKVEPNKLPNSSIFNKIQ